MSQLLLRCHLIEPTEQILFDLQVFYNGLQHQVGALSRRSSICRGGHALQDLLDELFTRLKQPGRKLPLMSHISFRHQLCFLKKSFMVCLAVSHRWLVSELLLDHSLEAPFNSLDGLLEDVVARVHQRHGVAS